MTPKNILAERALGNLMLGKYYTFSILCHPELRYHFYGCGHDYTILKRIL